MATCSEIDGPIMTHGTSTMARRCYSINEALIRLMDERIKAEVGKMIAAGASIEQVNETLPHIIFFTTLGVRKHCSVSWLSLPIWNGRVRQMMSHRCGRTED